MELRDKTLIYFGAIAGLVTDKTLSEIFFAHAVSNEESAHPIIVIIAGIIASASLGHVLRHSRNSFHESERQDNQASVKNKQLNQYA